MAQDSPVVRVEEDWELVVSTPTSNNTAPQITCVISPLGHVELFHAVFELNHQSLPDFVAGGVQLQLWYGNSEVSHQKTPSHTVLSTPEETITWTQAIEIDDAKMVFEVVDGVSDTWGEFGGEGNLKLMVDSPLSNLNAYDPTVSVANSGVSYAANLVQSLTLKRVRIYREDETSQTFETEQVIHLTE